MTQQAMSINPPTMVNPQPMTVGQPGMGQPGMPVAGQPQIVPSQPGMMPGFMTTGPGGVGAGPLNVPISTMAPAQSPLDVFVGPTPTDAPGQQQGAAQQEMRQQQQKIIWSGEQPSSRRRVDSIADNFQHDTPPSCPEIPK